LESPYFAVVVEDSEDHGLTFPHCCSSSCSGFSSKKVIGAQLEFVSPARMAKAGMVCQTRSSPLVWSVRLGPHRATISIKNKKTHSSKKRKDSFSGKSPWSRDEEPHSIPGPIFESPHTLMVEDGRGGKRARGTGSEITQVEMDGGGARVMPGSGERSKIKQGVDRTVQIYDNGVESGDLTGSHGSNWADTLANREDEVETTAFWGQNSTTVPLLTTDCTFTGSPSFTGSPRTISYLSLSCRASCQPWCCCSSYPSPCAINKTNFKHAVHETLSFPSLFSFCLLPNPPSLRSMSCSRLCPSIHPSSAPQTRSCLPFLFPSLPSFLPFPSFPSFLDRPSLRWRAVPGPVPGLPGTRRIFIAPILYSFFFLAVVLPSFALVSRIPFS
jgi:hypothetical protein